MSITQPSGSYLSPYVSVQEPLTLLYLEDCLCGMRSVLEKETVSVVVTSPPYNIGVKYNGYPDNKEDREYVDWMGKVALELKRVLEPSGSIFLNMGTKPSNPTLAWQIALKFTEYFKLQNVIHWIKSIAISKEDVGCYHNVKEDIAVGHYKPTVSRRFLHNSHEYVFHFNKSGQVELDVLSIGVPYHDKSNIGRWKRATQDKRSRGNVWFIPYETITNSASRSHPSTFPVKLPEMCIKLHGLSKAKLVLDPFIGVGSTALACQKLGIPCIGFEIDKSYLTLASERLKHDNEQKTRLKKLPQKAEAHQPTLQSLTAGA